MRDKKQKQWKRRHQVKQDSETEDEFLDQTEKAMIKFQVSCEPFGSKLKKPTDFFQKCFSKAAKTGDHLDIAQVQYLSQEIFLVETSAENYKAVERLMKKGAVDFAGKTIKILQIVQSSHVPGGSAAYHPLASAAKNDDQNSKTTWLGVADSTDEGIVAVHGNICELGLDKLRLFIENKKYGGGDIEVDDLDAKPPTIKFHNKEVAKRLVAKGVHEIEGIQICYLAKGPEKAGSKGDQTEDFGLSSTLEILGDVSGIWPGLLLAYLSDVDQSGGGGIFQHDFSASPPTITFYNEEAARIVARKGKHTLDGAEFFLQYPTRVAKAMNCREKDAEPWVDERVVEIHDGAEKIGKEILLMYLENKKRSGGGEVEKDDFDVTPPSVTFCEGEAARRVVERGKHTIDGKEFFLKFPDRGAKALSGINAEDVEKEIDQRVVEIHGCLTEIGTDTLEMYLESRRRSSGGEIEDNDFNAIPPTVTFCEVEAARRVVERGKHTLGGAEFFLKFPDRGAKALSGINAEDAEKEIDQRVVEIHGCLTEIGTDTLEMYLESRRRSSGGEIEDNDFNAIPPTVTFCEVEAARRVVERGKHTLGGAEFFLKFPDRGAKALSGINAEDAEKEIDQRVVEIHGCLTEIGTDTLEMYLESRRRSSGGEIEDNDFNAIPPTVTFCEVEAARRVVERGKHTIGGAEFFLKFPDRGAKASSDSGLKDTERTVDERRIEIHGDISAVKRETLRMYFENKRRSGGGDIEKVDFDAVPPTVTFQEAEAASRLVSKSVHNVSDTTFVVKKPEPKMRIAYKNDTVLIRNLNPTTSLDTLTLYMERICSCETERIIYSHDRVTAIVTLREQIDWDKVMKVHGKRDTVDGNKVEIERIGECMCIFISNISKDTSKDALELKLEKLVGDDSIEEVYYKRGRGFATAKCKSPQVASQLTDSKMKLDDKDLVIEEYYPNCIQDHILKSIQKKPDEITIKVDPMIMRHVKEKHMNKVRDALKSDCCMKEEIANGQTTHFASFLSMPEVPNPVAIFNDIYNQFTVKDLPFNQDFSYDRIVQAEIEKKRYDVTLHSIPNGKMTLVGDKDNIEMLLRYVDDSKNEMAATEQIIECPNEKCRLLQATGYWKELEEAAKVRLSLCQNGIKVRGTPQQISVFETKLAIKLSNMKERSVGISANLCSFLTNERGCKSASELIEKHDLRIWYSICPSQKEVAFVGLSQNDLLKGIEQFLGFVKDSEHPLPKEEISFLRSPKGSEILKDIRKEHAVGIYVTDTKVIYSGVKAISGKAQKKVSEFLQKNSFQTRTLPLTRGKARAILEIFGEKCISLVHENLENELSVGLSKDKCGIKVSGRGFDTVALVLDKLTSWDRELYREVVVFQRPGLKTVLESNAFKDSIRSLELEKKVVLITKDEDHPGSISIEEIENEYEIVPISSSSMLVCQFSTTGGQTLAVYKGDITDCNADAIVNPANGRLRLGAGVAGAILSKGGSGIQEECNAFVAEFGELNESDVATTNAGKLSCKKVIHAFGPQWVGTSRHVGEAELKHRRKACEERLAKTMKNVLKEAEKESCRILAVPAISSGVYGFPKDICARILTTATIELLGSENFETLKGVHFINNDAPTVELFSKEFSKSFGSQKGFEVIHTVEDISSQVSIKNRRGKEAVFRTTQKLDFSKTEQRKRTITRKDPVDATDNAVKVIKDNVIKIEMVIGDLAKIEADIIVNSASSNLDLSTNPCARSLSKGAGNSLQQECKAWVDVNGILPQYSFAITNGGKLQCQFVLHAVCGDYHGGHSEQALGELVMRLLNEASNKNAKSIAIPALGTGKLNFPRDKVAKILIDSVLKFSKRAPQGGSLKEVMLVAFHADDETIASFGKSLKPTLQEQSNEDSSEPGRMRRAPQKSQAVSAFQLEDKIFMLGNVCIEIERGDLTKEETDAIVVLGNESIDLAGAVGNAIVEAEGLHFHQNARKKAPQKAGSTELIKTDKLPSSHVAHVYPKSASYEDLKEGMKSMLAKCDSEGLSSISLPALGTGVMGKAPEESAKLIVHAVAELCVKNSIKAITSLRIILFEERMVDAFKGELMHVLSDPEKYLSNVEMSVTNWIKKKFSIIKNFFSSSQTVAQNKEREQASRKKSPGSKRESPWLPITFHIYGNERKAVSEVEQKLDTIFEDRIATYESTKEAYKKLAKEQIDSITCYAEKRDVLFELDKDNGTMRFTGYHKDAANIMVKCQDMAHESAKEEQERKQQQDIAKYVQWKEKQSDGTIINYDPSLNFDIEGLHQGNEVNPLIEMEDENGMRLKFQIDFKLMTVTNVETQLSNEIIREDLSSSKSTLPDCWEKMPKDSAGNEIPVHLVTLQDNSQEFIEVKNLFLATAGKQVAEIRRIQNPHLYKSFIARKESMEKTGGKNVEKKLFHGTRPDAVAEINETGFNRSFAGVNGVVYGLGVYFARDASYSVGYCQQTQGSSQRSMYLARVLVGNFTNGVRGMKVPPKGYDSVVNNAGNPTIHVVFYDNQCYPEYLIFFN